MQEVVVYERRPLYARLRCTSIVSQGCTVIRSGEDVHPGPGGRFEKNACVIYTGPALMTV